MLEKEKPSWPHSLKTTQASDLTFRQGVGRMVCLVASTMASVRQACGVPFAVLRVSSVGTMKFNECSYMPFIPSRDFTARPVLMGQIMQRMMLTWLGEPGPRVSTKNSFLVVLVITVCYFIYSL